MSNDSITLDEVREEIQLTIDEIAHRGAQRMLAVALEADVEAYLAMPGQKDEQGRAQVVRNNYARERTIQSGAGIIKVKALRVYDKRAEQKFTNRILPPYMRKTPRLEVAVPVLYLRGLSTGDFREALAALLGEEAVAGFSATTVTRLLAVWQEEYKVWHKRPLAGKAYTYVWADGVHFNIRLAGDRLAALVIVGVTPEGHKELFALEDGYRESTESRQTVLRDLKRRGLPATQLAVGDGALDFWATLRDVFPKTEDQRCWVYKLANVLDKLPKRLQPQAKLRYKWV